MIVTCQAVLFYVLVGFCWFTDLLVGLVFVWCFNLLKKPIFVVAYYLGCFTGLID